MTEHEDRASTAYDLVLRAYRSGDGADDLARQLAAWEWSATYRSRSDVDDTEHDPNAIQVAYLARNLDLLTNADLERILQLAAARHRPPGPTTLTSAHARRHWRATLHLAQHAPIEITVRDTPKVAIMHVDLARRALDALAATDS